MSSAYQDIDQIIIGGGVIGLFCALELRTIRPEATIVLLEKNSYLGEETSSRNSGVLHSGIYYPTNSLKHLHCLEGNKLWRDFCRKYDIPITNCGKYIVSSSQDDNVQLESLFHHANDKNHVKNLRWITTEEKETLNSFINCQNAFFSQNTAIIDVPIAIYKLQQIAEENNIIMMKDYKVNEISSKKGEFFLKTNQDNIKCSTLINCAGLNAISLRKNLGLYDFENYYVKGNYIKATPDPKIPFLIYPVPPKDGLGLGVHSTINSDGTTKFGPNTQITNDIDYHVNEDTLEEMKKSVLKVFKNLENRNFHADYSGVRPKIKRNGKLINDFIVQSPLKNYIEFLGIDSPGLTAAPSLAKLMRNL